MIKRIFTIVIISFLSLFTVTNALASSVNDQNTPDAWPESPSIYAEAGIVIDASTGLILYEKNINEQYYPASITKIMTALLAIENSSLSDIVTFSRKAIFDVEAESSRIGIDVGEKLTMQQCLYAVLLESANEVSYAVAEHVGGDVENFAKMMNDKARSLGCLNTNFVNPHGLPDSEHLTSSYDMALITREAMKYETFRKIVATRTYTIPPTNIQPESRPMANHHKFIRKETYFYDDCIGGKTGYTSKAKYTLVTIAKRGDLEIISVIMRDDTSEHQYKDTQKLLDYAFDNFSIYPVNVQENASIINESPFFTRYNQLLSKSDQPITTDDTGFVVLPNTATLADAQKDITFFEAPKVSDEKNIIGSISYSYKGKYVGGTDIIFSNEVTPELIHKAVKPEAVEQVPLPSEPELEKSSGKLRPIIIGVIISFIVLVAGLYFLFVERPRLKRRNAYNKRRANRKSYQFDDFLDL